MTLDLYSHLAENMQRDAADRFEADLTGDPGAELAG
jgi:hypothetical protein